MIRRLFSTSFVSNLKLPICVNCEHFMENITYPPDNETGTCTRFGTMHLVSGVVIYELAIKIRKNEFKCGETATYFIKK